LSTDLSTRLSELSPTHRKLLAAKLRGLATPERKPVTDGDLRDALFHRVEGYLRESISHLDERGLLEAVEAPTPGDTIARVMAAAPDSGVARDPWTEALVRGARIKQETIALAGGLLSSGEVATLLGVSVAAVKQRQRRGKLLAVPLANGEWGYPARQFAAEGRVHGGLAQVLAAFDDVSPWIVLSFLTNPVPGCDSGIAFDALSDADATRKLVEVARTYGAQGAA
jgi:hypothetical protein